MADEKTTGGDARRQGGPRAAGGRGDVRDVDGRSRADRLHRDREVARAPQEGEAVRRDLLRLVRRRRRRRGPAGDVRLQRRPGRLVRLSAPRCRRPATGRLPRGRNASGDAAAARAERGVLARLRRPRVRRPGRNGIQPRDRGRQEGRRGEGRQEERRDRPDGVLRAEARPRVALRVHGTVAVEQRPLGIARLRRGRELRRLSRRAHGADAAGERRDRAERSDPDLAGARDLVAEPQRLRRPRLDRPAADDGGRRRASRPLARLRARHAARQGAGRGGEVRHQRVRRLPRPAARRWGRRSATAFSPGWPI